MSKPIDLKIEVEQTAMNIVYQIMDGLMEQGKVDVDFRQQNNDRYIDFTTKVIASLLKDVEREVNAVELSRRITEVQKDIDDIGGGNFLKFVNKEYIVANEFNPQSSNYDWVDVEYVDQWSQGDSGDSFSGYLYVWLYDDVFGVWEYSTY